MFEEFESYLNLIAENETLSSTKVFKEFCEMGKMTTNLSNCKRYKEGYLKKRSGGRHKHEK